MKIYSASLNYADEIKKAEAGDIASMVRVAFAILHGNKSEVLQPEEAERAIRYYKKAAELGDKSAMLDLGACYMNGRGVKRDVEESIRWYERGWDPEDPNSCFCLGCINRYDYLDDLSEVPTADNERISKAIKYFRRGTALLDSNCMYELGELYFSGTGVPKNKKKAFSLFESAYEEHDDEILSDRYLRILLRLAECWHHGFGTEADIEEAYDFICLFREEWRRRQKYGEEEETYIIERSEHEWIEINREFETTRENRNGNVGS